MKSSLANQEPPRIVLLLDTSGSMYGLRSASEMNFSLDLAENLVSSLPSSYEIGLEFFSTEFDPVSRPTSDRKMLMNQLESLRSHPSSFKGRTALWSAILNSLKLFDHPHIGDAIYVMTDGGDNASKVTKKYVTQTLAETGVRLFAFVFQQARRPSEEELGPIYVKQIVDDTGGAMIAYVGTDLINFPLHAVPALFDDSGKITRFGSLLASQYRQIHYL